MAGELFAGLSAFKSMFDLAKGLKELDDSATRNAVAIELQEKILAAQAQQSTLIERVSELEAQVAAFEKWETEKQRYELCAIADGQYAYALKEEASASEPPHLLCANCYADNRKSILQTETRDPGRHKVLFCQHCDSEMFSPETGGRGERHRPSHQNRQAGSWVSGRRGSR